MKLLTFNYFIFFICLVKRKKNLSEVYDKKINTCLFQYHPGYHSLIHISSRFHLVLIWGSQDNTWADMEKVILLSLYLIDKCSIYIFCNYFY